MEKPNLVGMRFGRLLVTASTVSKHNRSRWICQCDCGTICVKTGKYMRSGKSLSCGCIKREQSVELVKKLHEDNILPEGVASCNLLYAVYRWQAKKRGYCFELSRDEFREITSQDCTYCGIEPKQVFQGSSCKTPYTYNGIDRQDNKVGYTRENAVPCCKPCNLSKGKQTVAEFMKRCRAIAEKNSKTLAEMTNGDRYPTIDNKKQV
jgi:hypothetical protein